MMENYGRNMKTFVLTIFFSFLFCVPALTWNEIDKHTPPTITIKPPDLTKTSLPNLPKVPKVDEKLLKRSAKTTMPLVYHPSAWVRAIEVKKAISEIYTSSATAVEQTLINDLEKLKTQKAFYWASEEEKKRKNNGVRSSFLTEFNGEKKQRGQVFILDRI